MAVLFWHASLLSHKLALSLSLSLFIEHDCLSQLFFSGTIAHLCQHETPMRHLVPQNGEDKMGVGASAPE